MVNTSKNMILGSMVAAGLVALTAVIDLATGFPFQQQMVMDILFLISSGLVIYLGWEAYRDMA